MIENIAPLSNKMPLVDITKLSNSAAKRTGSGSDRVGEEFEAFFYSMLLKEMRETLDDGLFPGDQSDSFGGMFDMHLGQFLAKSQPLGISDLIAESETL